MTHIVCDHVTVICKKSAVHARRLLRHIDMSQRFQQAAVSFVVS